MYVHTQLLKPSQTLHTAALRVMAQGIKPPHMRAEQRLIKSIIFIIHYTHFGILKNTQQESQHYIIRLSSPPTFPSD